MDSILKFSYDWNKKLKCDFFTTLRLYNEAKYRVGATLEVEYKKEIIKRVQVQAMKRIMLHEINAFIAGLDTGYSIEQTKAILIKMYPKVNFQVQALSLVLLKTLKP